MPRLVLYTYEQPRGEVVKCSRCGFSVSSLMVAGGLCGQCRQAPPPRDSDDPLARKYASWRRDQGPITCACGCGETFPKYDERGRLRTFKSKYHRYRFYQENKAYPRVPCACGCGKIVEKRGRSKYASEQCRTRVKTENAKGARLARGILVGTRGKGKAMSLIRKLKLSLCPKGGTKQSA